MLYNVGILCVIIGFVFLAIGILGYIKFEDLFVKLHISSLIDNIGTSIILIGFALMQESNIQMLKMLILMSVIFILNPVSTHAIGKSAYLYIKQRGKNSSNGIYE
ncbi:MAG UNVERIFIED_CONTAM: monovalent cation/H(+) antiporter subunit G [Rickettsiaceae bacterium]|jgi:multicomponent Na+:H+ antiporter subunit G